MKNETKKKLKTLTEGNIALNMLLYALPLVVSYIISQSYSIVDEIIAGKFINEFSLGAVSSTASFAALFRALFNGFSAGCAIYVSQLFGKKDYAGIKRDIPGLATFVAFASIFVSALSILFRHPIMDYLKIDPALRGEAEIYFILYTAGYITTYVNLFLSNILHALGVTSVSIYISVSTALTKIAVTLLTVTVFSMGVAGLAVSTLVASGISTVIYIVILRKVFQQMECEPVGYKFSFSCVRRSLSYSLPATIQQVSFHGVSFLISPAINGLGAAATTGNSVANRMYGLATEGLWAAASAFACYTGQCVGEGSVKKIRRGVKTGFLLNCAVLLPFVAVSMLFADPIVSLFFPKDYTGEAFVYALRYATVFLPFVYVQLIGHFLHTYMRSLGRVKVVQIITLICSTIRVAATLLLVPVMHIDGVFVAQIISWAVDAVICTVLFFRLYRTDAHLEKILSSVHNKLEQK
ncbi:MAG: hypothetical protein IJX62_09365 [Clostridia bacterium]|nr:hypothetical protein [Clostridia bacterium]